MFALALLCLLWQDGTERYSELREWLLTQAPVAGDLDREPLKSLDARAAETLRGWVEKGYSLVADRRTEAKRLIDDLASDELATRDDAETRLAAIMGLVAAELREARVAAADEEVKLRLDRVLARVDPLQLQRFRVRAARVLVLRHDKSVMPLLIAALKDADAHVRGKYLYGLRRLSNGNTLIGAYDGFVAEVDPAGKTVWTFAEPGGAKAMDIERGE